MLTLAPKTKIIAYNKRLKPLKPKRLKERRAVTIGIGILCDDGVVLGADTLINVDGFHKYHECKLYHHDAENLTISFTFSGNPILMKSFDGEFETRLGPHRKTLDADGVQNIVKSVLSEIEILDQNPKELCLLCGITGKDSETRLLLTEGKAVTKATGLQFIGVGDSSILHYLKRLTTETDTGTYTIQQAFLLSVFFVLQAKRYVSDCDGESDVAILTNGRREVRGISTNYNSEQYMLLLEHHGKKVGAGFFDPRISEEEFKQELEHFCEKLIEQREEFFRMAVNVTRQFA